MYSFWNRILQPMAETSPKKQKNIAYWILGIAAVGYIAYKIVPLFKKLRSAKKVSDNLILNVINVNLQNREIIFKALNPTNGQLVIDSIAGDILANDNSIATFSKFDKITIQPNSESRFSLSFKVSAVNFLPIIKDIINLGSDRKKVMEYIKKIRLTAKGSANIDGIIIPIEQKIYN